jgi:hypothetical protein
MSPIINPNPIDTNMKKLQQALWEMLKEHIKRKASQAANSQNPTTDAKQATNSPNPTTDAKAN